MISVPRYYVACTVGRVHQRSVCQRFLRDRFGPPSLAAHFGEAGASLPHVPSVTYERGPTVGEIIEYFIDQSLKRILIPGRLLFQFIFFF